MKLAKRQAVWDEKVASALVRRYGSWPRAFDYYTSIWTAHLEAGLADGELVSALTGDDEPTRRQRIWEMQLGGHLRACGHVPERTPRGKPDYMIKVGNTVVWVEAISPAPRGQVPKGWLDEEDGPPKRFRIQTDGTACWPEQVPDGTDTDPSEGIFEFDAEGLKGAIPFDWILSRWTGALKDKHAKGLAYIEKGAIRPADAYVIAVDGGQLSKLPLAHGSSGLPFALEAAFPIGPRAFWFADDGSLLGTENMLRRYVMNHNGAPIPTERFLSAEFSAVSAVLGCCPSMFGEPELPVQVIHNPLARVPVSPGTFGKQAEEWRAVEGEDGDGRYWQVERCGQVAMPGPAGSVAIAQ